LFGSCPKLIGFQWLDKIFADRLTECMEVFIISPCRVVKGFEKILTGSQLSLSIHCIWTLGMVRTID